MPIIFIPFTNFSLSRGRLNSGALVQADGVAHIGHGYAAPGPLVTKATGIASDAADPTIFDPSFAHYNPNTSATLTKTLYYLQNDPLAIPPVARLYGISSIDASPPWTVTALGTITALIDVQAGGFTSFGGHEILAAGHGAPVQIRLATGGSFVDCFTSADKPRAKRVTSIGERLLFANIANTGSAGSPDPNTQLVWWGATDDARVIGNPVSHPAEATDFQTLADDHGDITGLAGGKKRAYIFKERGVHLMAFSGSLFGYGFDLISSGIGTPHPRSIATFGEDTYFWSNLGPAVVRAGQVLTLGDGYWTQRGFFMESPANPGFRILDTAVDDNNALVIWRVQYNQNTYIYDGNEPPTEKVDQVVLNEAFVCYSLLANQFSFLRRLPLGPRLPLIFFDTSTQTAEEWTVKAMVGGLPFSQQTMPMSGIGLIATRFAPAPLTSSHLLVSGFIPGNTIQPTQPERVIDASPYFGTGMVQLAPEENVMIQGVRPVVRSRRAMPVPTMRLVVSTSLTPFDVERRHGPFDSLTYSDDRNGWIRTPGIAQGNFAAFELEIASWSGQSWAGIQNELAYLLEDIEGVEVEYSTGGVGR